MSHGAGRSIQGAAGPEGSQSPFADDDGRPDPRWEAAYSRPDLVEALLMDGVRLLVPIVAVLDEVDESGADTSSHMAAVSMVQSDGRRGLLAFTGIEAMRRWDAQARPVPVTSWQAAQAAVSDGAAGILVDVSGPVRFAIDGDLLTRLAAGATPPDR